MSDARDKYVEVLKIMFDEFSRADTTEKQTMLIARIKVITRRIEELDKNKVENDEKSTSFVTQ